MQEQVPGTTCRLMGREVHNEAGLLAGLEIPCTVPEGLHPMEETHTGAGNEELQPIGRTHT